MRNVNQPWKSSNFLSNKFSKYIGTEGPSSNPFANMVTNSFKRMSTNNSDTPKPETPKPETPKPETPFKSQNLLLGGMLATAVGLGAHKLYKKIKEKRRQYNVN
jgi:hypothetical protein